MLLSFDFSADSTEYEINYKKVTGEKNVWELFLIRYKSGRELQLRHKKLKKEGFMPLPVVYL